MRILALALSFVSTSAVAAAQLPIVYVQNDISAPQGNGSAWGTNAYNSLEAALDPAINILVATNQDFEIYVQEGTYRPDGLLFGQGALAPRSATFLVPPAVRAIRGGFLGNESPTQSPNGGSTLLSGDIGVPGDPSDNCYHVVVLDRPGGEEIDLFNLTIVGGYADGPGLDDGAGGGILVHDSAVRMTDVVVKDNFAQWGGGISLSPGPDDRVANMRARRLRVRNNSVARSGGGIYVGSRTQVPSLASCTVRDNSASFDGGGIFISTRVTDFSIVSSRIFNNFARRDGGGILSAGSVGGVAANHRILNCTIAYNNAVGLGAGIYVDASVPSSGGRSLKVENSIVYSNPGPSTANVKNVFIEPLPSSDVMSFGHSLVGPRSSASTGLPSGQNTIDTSTPPYLGIEPDWVNPSARNFRLQTGSVCIDRGDDGFLIVDRADIDDDGIAGQETLPREFFMGDEGAVGGNDTTREVFKAGGFQVFTGVFLGVDGSVPGAICDIGAFEYRSPVDATPQ